MATLALALVAALDDRNFLTTTDMAAVRTAAVHAARLKTRLERVLERTRRQDGVDLRHRLASTELTALLVALLVRRATALVAARALGLGTTNLTLLAGLAGRALLARLDQNRVDFTT